MDGKEKIKGWFWEKENEKPVGDLFKILWEMPENHPKWEYTRNARMLFKKDETAHKITHKITNQKENI